jgi:mRNA interferase YafQ
MRRIERSTAFKRDYKRESKGRWRTTLDEDLRKVLTALVADAPLEVRYRDHDLIGDWLGYRDCHIKPDLVLIYRKPDSETLLLARLGSHSEVFG